MQQPENNKLLASILASLIDTREDAVADHPQFSKPELDAFKRGFADGVESGSLGTLFHALRIMVAKAGSTEGDVLVLITELLVQFHNAGHVLRGVSPGCAAIELMLAEAAIKLAAIPTPSATVN